MWTNGRVWIALAAGLSVGLGASLGRRGGEDLGLVYLQLSLYLTPTHPLALLSLADLYESLKKPQFAIKVYERIPASSPLHRNAAIQMASSAGYPSFTALAMSAIPELRLL